MPTPTADRATVLDAAGRPLSPTSAERAWRLIEEGAAELLSPAPLTIRLRREVERPAPPAPPPPAGRGRRLLLHACCGPCAAYPTQQLRREEFAVAAFWYNPNIHPFAEHERRREAMARFAAAAELELRTAEGYDLVPFLRAVAGHESLGERCRICYRLRLERTARAAREGGFDAFSTTLLISPHQDEAALREIGEEVGAAAGVPFYYERFRRGYGERGRQARELGLYLQDYCGCLYSEWERRRCPPHP